MFETLERKSLDGFDTGVKDLRLKLAEEAKTKLGYSSSLLSDRPLAKVLRDLGIRPFTARSVKAYKEKMENRVSIDQHIARAFGWGLFTLANLPMAVAQHASIAGYSTTWGDHWALGLLQILGTIASGLLVVFGYSNDLRPIRKWERADIGSYNGHIPDHVLNRAVTIHDAAMAVPSPTKYGLTMGVEYMTESERQRVVRDPDPFLYVQQGAERYYVEVWDERDYKEEVINEF